MGWGAAGAVISAFLIGYAAPYLPPAWFWWTNLFAVLLPALGVVVGLLSLALLGHGLYRRRWGRVVVAGVLLVTLLLRFAPRVGVGDASATDERTLRLMTFNVPMSYARKDTSARALARFVQRQAPDVLAFQESWMSTEVDPWAERKERFWPPRAFLEDSLGYAPPQARPLGTTICQPVLGRLPLDSVSIHPLPPDGEKDPCSRYTRTEFTWQGRPAVLYNVHLHSVGSVRPWNGSKGWGSLERWHDFLHTYRGATMSRVRQARLIRRRIEQETRPVLVAGDFNSTPHQWAYRHVAAGMQSATEQDGWDWSPTFPARRPIVRIDHILAGPEWDLVTARVPALKGDTAISDHRPVVAQLRWAAGYSE